MVNIIFEPEFKKEFIKLKNKELKEKIIKQISKIKNNPCVGKPMKHNRKGTRELYISPYRLSYCINKNIVYILSIYHKKKQ